MFFERVYAIVSQVPPGRVVTYGDVSRLIVGHAQAARTVGWALRALAPGLADEVPWWRVVNAQGRISIRGRADAAREQRQRLEVEGVAVDDDYGVDLDQYAWYGD